MADLEETLGTDIAHKSDLLKTASGDIGTISGLENLKWALFHRLVTIQGSLAHRPGYGVGISRYEGAISSLSNQRRIALDIQEQFLLEPRLESLESVRFEVDDAKPDLSKIIIKAKVVGFGETEFEFTPFGEGV